MSEELLRISTIDGKYTVVQPRHEQVRIDRYGSLWMGPGFQGSNAVLSFAYELEELRAAVTDIYNAGLWSCDRPVDAAALWTRLRDAAGIKPGTATAARMADRCIPCETVRLNKRVDELLEANNRELERRRTGERLLREAAALFRLYEKHHRAKVEPAAPETSPRELDDALDRMAKAQRNASIAERLEGFLDHRLTPAVDLYELMTAAQNLRRAQRAYLADRGNEDLGRAVGEAATKLDEALGVYQ